jgi:hypothetical protein
MSSLVAWSPVREGNGPLIFSVLVNEAQKLNDRIYLDLLGDRVQRGRGCRSYSTKQV